MDIGSAVGREKRGVSAEELLALPDYEDSPLFSEADRAALALADAMTATPAAVSDGLFARLRPHFDDAQLVELAAGIAQENFRARFNIAFAIEAEGFSEGAACAVPAPAPRSGR